MGDLMSSASDSPLRDNESRSRSASPSLDSSSSGLAAVLPASLRAATGNHLAGAKLEPARNSSSVGGAAAAVATTTTTSSSSSINKPPTNSLLCGAGAATPSAPPGPKQYELAVASLLHQQHQTHLANPFSGAQAHGGAPNAAQLNQATAAAAAAAAAAASNMYLSQNPLNDRK